jgi:hypothetical protein
VEPIRERIADFLRRYWHEGNRVLRALAVAAAILLAMVALRSLGLYSHRVSDEDGEIHMARRRTLYLPVMIAAAVLVALFAVKAIW